MTDTNLPPPPPVKSNAPLYIALVALLGLGAGAFIFTRGGTDSPSKSDANNAPTVQQPAEPPKTPAPPPPPPPPLPAEEEASAAVAAAPSPTPKHERAAAATGVPTVSAPEGCGGTCNGRADASLKNTLAQVGASARSCYNNALRNNSTLSGKVTVAVRVAPNGSTCGARITGDTLHDASVTSCIVQKFRSAKFPKPAGGCVDGEVPINLVAPK